MVYSVVSILTAVVFGVIKTSGPTSSQLPISYLQIRVKVSPVLAQLLDLIVFYLMRYVDI